ncbi:MAG: homoserine dehydrogenase [Ktedonobacterales bacterium]|nr:homoserine dehydrogenase [Ktedonobacterales bacterium]
MRLVIVGYGNVGRLFGELLAEKMATLRGQYHLTPRIVGVVTGRRGGWIAENPEGIAASVVAEAGWPATVDVPVGAVPFSGDALALLNAVDADALVELSPTNPATGEPALSYVRAALAKGLHVVTANKGPIALAYRELRDTAAQHGVQLRFESAVMDGTPIINLAQFTLPATEILGVRAIINATSNFILSGLVAGQSFDETLARAQQIGIAEADPSLDLDGWDAAVKLTIIANVLMGADIRPQDVVRESSAAHMQTLTANLSAGSVAKQVATITRTAEGVEARVVLHVLTADDSLAGIGQGKAAIQFTTDTMGDLTIIEGPGTPRQTAFGVLADLITIAAHR